MATGSLNRCSGLAHADGVLPSANVPRPAASSFISLRGAHHRREPSEPWFTSGYRTLLPMPRVRGVSRSEIKEEPKAGDIRGGRYPVASARAPKLQSLNLEISQ